MSHIIPHYYRYVSSVTIDNPGSGYGSTPTLTFSGGGGTGATATCEVYSGEIVSVTITNIGSGYMTSPTITVTGGGGSGAVLSAGLSFATNTAGEYDRTSALLLEKQFPEFVVEDHPKFVSFLKKYYEFTDQLGNSSNVLLNTHINDIDSANEQFIEKWAKYLGIDFPKTTAVARTQILKRLKDIYETKGSRRSIEMFFRALYNEEVEVYYPQQYLLRASDGRWVEEKSIKITAAAGIDPLDLPGKEVEVHYYNSIGSVTTARAIPGTVERVEKIAYTSPQVYECFLNFDDEHLSSIPGPGAGATYSITVVSGVITAVDVTSGGTEYLASPTLTVGDNTGTGAELRAFVENGQISSVSVIDGGSGYVDPSIVEDTTAIRTHLAIGEHLEEVQQGYLVRTLISAATTAGSITDITTAATDTGFRVGDTFEINESGDDGRGYALDYFSQDYVLVGGRNGAFIRITEVDEDNYNAPISWEIITSGVGFNNVTTDLNVTSRNGTVITITILTGYLLEYPGKYLDDRGKLSDINVLQDNKKWQKYSYVVRTSTPQTKWEGPLKELVHPAGMEVFSDLIIKHNLDFAANINVYITGTTFRKFLTDVADADTLLVELDITLNKSELLTVTETVFDIEYFMNKEETVVTSELVAKDFTLPKVDSSTVSDSTDLLLTFVRTFADVGIASDDNIFSVGLNKADIASATEDYTRELSKVSTDEVFTIEFDGKDLSKPLTDSGSVLDTFAKATEYVRGFSETQTVSDEDYYSYAKVSTEALTASETINSFEYDKINSDAANVTESDSKEFASTKTDDATVDEIAEKEVNIVVEGFGLGGLGDDVNLDEELNFAVQSYVNGDYFLEDYVGTYFTVINKQKAFIESVTPSDNTTYTTNKVLTDTTSATDTGSLVKEDYSSEAYFQEDYVGSSSSFT